MFGGEGTDVGLADKGQIVCGAGCNHIHATFSRNNDRKGAQWKKLRGDVQSKVVKGERIAVAGCGAREIGAAQGVFEIGRVAEDGIDISYNSLSEISLPYDDTIGKRRSADILLRLTDSIRVDVNSCDVC